MSHMLDSHKFQLIGSAGSMCTFLSNRSRFVIAIAVLLPCLFVIYAFFGSPHSGSKGFTDLIVSVIVKNDTGEDLLLIELLDSDYQHIETLWAGTNSQKSEFMFACSEGKIYRPDSHLRFLFKNNKCMTCNTPGIAVDTVDNASTEGRRSNYIESFSAVISLQELQISIDSSAKWNVQLDL